MRSERSAEARWVIGVGFEKCGTTYLEAVLRETPGFCTPRNIKETWFFASNFHKGYDWFLNLFSPKSESDIYVESTPYYIRDITSLERIANFATNLKIIINLRNPVYRAFSHYWHNIYHHHCVFNSAVADTISAPATQLYSKTFYDEYEAGEGFLFTRYCDLVLRVISMFGKSNVLILVLERDFFDKDVFEGKLSNFLERDVILANINSVKNSAQVPWVISPTNRGRLISLHESDTIKACELGVLRNGALTRIQFSQEEELTRYLQNSTRWTRFLRADDAKEMYDRFFSSDVSRLEYETGENISAQWSFVPLQI